MRGRFEILKNMSNEECAKIRYPNPQGWNSPDMNDANYRQWKAEIQRKAYIKGREDEKKLSLVRK